MTCKETAVAGIPALFYCKNDCDSRNSEFLQSTSVYRSRADATEIIVTHRYSVLVTLLSSTILLLLIYKYSTIHV